MIPSIATSFEPAQVVDKSESIDLETIHDFAVNVILRAGVLLRKHTLLRASQSRQESQNAASTSALKDTEVKASQVDLVTKVDVALEDFIREEIQRVWPNHEIVAEESFGKNTDVKQTWKRGRGPTWFIDPLDGTLNATHLFPLHCISIGFACSHKHSDYQEPIYDDALVGVIYAPSMGATGSLWSGARGHGAYLSYPTKLPKTAEDKESIAHGCSLSELKQSSTDLESSFAPAQRLPLIAHSLPSNAPSGVLFASEWGKDRRRGQNGQGNLSRKMKTMTNMAANDWPKDSEEEAARYVHGIRSLGSSTLDLAFVAQGSIDVLWEGGCWEWDVCAGVALLLESGGLLTDSNPPRKSNSPFWQKDNRLPRADLGARRFLAVRGCIDTETENALEAQERVARQIWSRTDGLNYHREGVLYEVDVDHIKHASRGEGSAKSIPSAPNWNHDPLKERKRLTKEEAKARADEKGSQEQSEGTFGGRLLDDEKDPWQFNAWDHVEPPKEYLDMVENKLATQAQTKLSLDEAAKYHEKPADYWNEFYSIHENKFFKDRRWLYLEFPELIAASKPEAGSVRILEVGCGAGNTVFPLLECNKNPDLEIFACDYAPEAVNVVKCNPLYNKPSYGKCVASVWDLSSTLPNGEPNLPEGVEAQSLDIVVLIFVLSALHPNEWQKAIANVRTMLKPGGLVLVRDYGRYDLPQIRFGKGRMLDDNFYIRGDGTRVYFFLPEEFLQIFNASSPQSLTTSTEEGDKEINFSTFSSSSSLKTDFKTIQLAIDRRMLLNRKEKKQMFRNWLQAKFQYTL